MIGRVIGGKYRIARAIRGGGMGVVYEAVHEGTGKHVALKLISLHVPAAPPSIPNTAAEARIQELVSRFQREARAAGAFDSKHIVQIFDTGTDEETGCPYMVMELLTGRDVQQLLRQVGCIAPDVAVRIVAQACIGLGKAHDAGVVHRDIKPGNLFLAEREGGEVIVKILDFGIAKIRETPKDDGEATELTRTGSMLGSPHYMSPEQVKGLKSLDRRADIWSLGIVLYKLLSGRTPHQDIETTGQIMLAICTERPRPVQQRAPWVEPGLAAVVHRALRMDPEQRFSSMDEMREALQPFLSKGTSLSRDMLAPVSDDVKTLVAERFESARPPADPDAIDTVLSGALPSGGRVSAAVEPRGARSRSRLGLGLAAMVAAAVGFVGWRDFSRRATHDSAAAMPEPSASAEAARSRRVKVRIDPPSAAVLVDGAKVEPSAGGVEIAGALGSTHAIRVSEGNRVVEAAVAITENGALPDQIALGAPSVEAPPPATTPSRGAPIPSGRASAATAARTPSPGSPRPATNPSSSAPKKEIDVATTIE